jgi:predicted metalloendopeptidase
MDTERKRFWAKGLAVLLSFSMVAGMAGCGGAGKGEGSSSESTQVTSEIVGSSEAGANTEGTIATPEPVATVSKINDNGKAIWDFDEFVNSAWKEEQKSGDKDCVTTWGETDEELNEWITELVWNTDLATIPEEEGLSKVITLCRQIEDEGFESRADRVRTVKKHLEPILKVKKLDDLYKLYGTEEYAYHNYLLQFQINMDWNANNAAWFWPEALLGNDIESAQEQIENMTGKNKDVFFPFMKELGFSEDRTKEILTNVALGDAKVFEYHDKAYESSVLYYFGEKQLQQEEVPVPIMQILQSLGYDNDFFVAKLVSYDYLKDLYQPENLGILRDHLLFSVIMNLSITFGSIEELGWIDDAFTEDYTKKELLVQAIKALACDEITKEYVKTHISEKTMEDVKAMVEDVKVFSRSVVSDAQWLSIHGKELAKRKILRLNCYYGENEIKYDLSEYSLGKDVVESFIALESGRVRFKMDQTKFSGDERGLYGITTMIDNAFYIRELNAVAFMAGFLSDPLCSAEAKYEERLANLGETIAHEISHAYDPEGSGYDEDGYYDPWMKEEEQAAYDERVKRIADFFDGMEVEYGQKLDGRRVCAETFADLMAMECCLRMLEAQENPDYDLFFRSYAKGNAMYFNEEGAEGAVEDTHLPGKQRINYVLGQFDKFYEIYDIDESSPFFVPKEERLPVF